MDSNESKNMEMEMEMKMKMKKKQKMIMVSTSNKEYRTWEDLDKDVLLTIYQKLTLKDLIVGAPLCCTSWYKVSNDPSLWKNLDLKSSFEYYPTYTKVKPKDLVKFVVNRSQGLLNSIQFPSYDTTVDDLLYVAERCPKLKHFDIFMPDKKVLKKKDAFHMAISKLNELESMDVTDAFLRDEITLKKIRECCPKLIKLKFTSNLSEKAATRISTSLPKLKVLELPWITNREALLVILKDCKELEYLDVTECGIVLDGDVEIHQIAQRLKEFKWKDKYVDPDSYEYWFDGDCGLTASSDDDSDDERKRRAACGGDPYGYDPIGFY